MDLLNVRQELSDLARTGSRRTFMKGAFAAAAVGGAAAAGFPSLFGTASAAEGTGADTNAAILKAARTAEELATTFYYQGVAGPTAANLGKVHDANNLNYFQAALWQEYQHVRILTNPLGATSYASGTFYLPTAWFDNSANFLAALDVLETAFIGAYLAAIREFAENGFPFYSEVAGDFLGTETEHRVLGRITSGSNPPNNWILEKAEFQTVGAAVGVLGGFLSPGPGTAAYTMPTPDQISAAAAPFNNLANPGLVQAG
jgi:hypothetical protein